MGCIVLIVVGDARAYSNTSLQYFGNDSKSNRLNLKPIPSFLPILTVVKELLIMYIYIFIYKSYINAASNIAILTIFTTLAKTY